MRLLPILIAAALATPAAASSPDAWKEFRADVAARCGAAAKAQGLRLTRLVVHPWGTESRGVAFLFAGEDSLLCLMDKRTKAIELTPAL